MKLVTLFLALALASLFLACTSAEERAEERIERAEEELVDAFEELMEIEDPPASREALRDARKELAALIDLWEEVLVHAAAAEEVLEREGYSDYSFYLRGGVPKLEQRREEELDGHENELEDATESSLDWERGMIAAHMDTARKRIRAAKEVVARPAKERQEALDRDERADAVRADGLRELDKLEQLFSEIALVEREIQDAHTDPYEKRWAQEAADGEAQNRRDTLAWLRQSLDAAAEASLQPRNPWSMTPAGDPARPVRAIVSAQQDAAGDIEAARQHLEELRAAANQ